MPQLSIDHLRKRLHANLAASSALRPLVVFSCQHAASSVDLQGADVSVIDLQCAGQLPPSFIEYAVRKGAAGVLVLSCPENGCEFRLGQRWTAQRFARQRQPQLRFGVAIERLQLVFAGPGQEAVLDDALHRLQEQIQATLPSTRRNANETIY